MKIEVVNTMLPQVNGCNTFSHINVSVLWSRTITFLFYPIRQMVVHKGFKYVLDLSIYMTIPIKYTAVHLFLP